MNKKTVRQAQLVMATSAALLLSACSGAPESTTEEPARSTPANTAPALSDPDLARVCRAAIGALNGRDPSIITVESVEGGLAKVAYHRPDDGKLWKNQCRVEGNRVVWAAVDLSGPGSGPGRWRVDPQDEIVTYSIAPNTVRIEIAYVDGSTDGGKTYTLS